MDLPTRTKQQKAESESYAILLYKLRRLGIFRNLTENDYGIDFEIELVLNDKVTGRYFKAQVKSAENIYIRAPDGVPTVGGIKQSTLAYWCELSHRTHVVAYAVDLANETIYVSRPLFWQATRLMDGSDASKSIEFLPRPADKSIDQDQLVKSLSVANALSPSVPDTLYAITTALRYLNQFLELRIDAFHYDPGTELHHPEVFRAFLEVCSILLAFRDDDVPLPEEDRKSMYSFEHWARKAHSTEVTCQGAQAPMKALLPMLVTRLREFRELVMAGAYYWSVKNPQFLELVANAPLPAATDDKTLDEWGYRYVDQVR